MYVPVPALPTQLTKVKTEVSFRAENPWNGNQLGTFHLDDYVVTLRGANSVPQRAYEGPSRGGYHRALRSEGDGISRFLPESLIELWLTKQAPTESLPGLLKQMEPQLKRSDYKPMLRSMKIKVLIIVEMVLCAALVSIAIVAAVLAQATWWVAATVVLGTAGVCWGFLYLLYFEKLFRRKRQMRWLLNRTGAGHEFPATQPTQPDLTATPMAKPPGTSEHARTFAPGSTPDDQLLILHPFDDAQLLPRDWRSQPDPPATAAPSASKLPEQTIQIEPKTPSQPAIPRQPQTQAASQSSEAGKPVNLPHLADFDSMFGLPPSPPPQLPIEERLPPPLPPWNVPHDYTYDTNLSVPGGIEPRMESILQRDIPEFRWQEEAENWGKIRIVGNSLEPFEGVTVSITRNEPPGPFNLRITVRGAIRPAADAFHKAITQRIELALYAAAKGPPKVQPSFTKSEKPFHPPFFSRKSILCVSREPGMALTIKDAIPELIWLDQAPDWEELRIIATRDHPRTVVSILRGDPTGPFLELWVHTAATSATIARDVRSKEVLNSLLDRIYAATQAYPPTVTFNNELSMHEKRLPWLASILQKGIPELNWRNDPKKSDPADTLRIVGTNPDPDQGVFVSITPAQPSSSPYTRLRIEIVLHRCFEHHAEPFHRALLQRLNHSLRPNSYHLLESTAPEALQTEIIEFFVSLISTPFVRPFFSLRAEVRVAETFENDGASAFVLRLRDNIPELVWTSAAEDKGKIRIAAESDRPADCPAAAFPTANRIQYTRLSLFRPGPSTPFELWIHITAGSSDEADRALHSLEHRLRLVFSSASDADLNRNAQSLSADPL